MPNLTDVSVIKDLCARYGFSLSKGYGQNFIINPGVCPKIVQAAGIDKSYGVLEVGPDIGVLTKELAAAASRVAAVEVDPRLPALLAETLADQPNVEIVQGDVLKTDLHALIAEKFEGLQVAVCANLPYYITSPIVMKLLEERLPVRHITVMVQKEAAERITAAPGTRAAGAISYAVHYYAKPQLLFTVQPGSFYPPPKVTSAVIRLELRDKPAVDTPDEAGLFRLIRGAFGQRRKAAANSIAAALGMPKAKVTAALEQAGLSPLVRPEQLTLEDFAALQQALLQNP